MSKTCKIVLPSGECSVSGQLLGDYTNGVMTYTDGKITSSADNASISSRKFVGDNSGMCDDTPNGKWSIKDEKIDRLSGGRGINRDKQCTDFKKSLLVRFKYQYWQYSSYNDNNPKLVTREDYINKYIKDEFLRIMDEINRTKVKGKQFGVLGECYTVGSRNLTETSWHTYGVAVDFSGDHNPRSNAYKNGGCPKCNGEIGDDHIHIRTKNHPVVQIFYKYGWRWGGTFNGDFDAMHFDRGTQW